MKRVDTTLWQGGCERAVTFSYDDGRYEDIRLIEMFNKYGLKGTFHLCIPEYLAILTGADVLVPAEMYGEVYKGHEMSCHMAHHPFPVWMPDEAVRAEITENRLFLEAQGHYPVRGMSYPYSNYDERVINICKSAGMEYARTVGDSFDFRIPENFMKWVPTCHHSRANDEIIEKFDRPLSFDKMRLMYVWGHSYEFNTEEKWQHMEDFCRKISGRKDVWYATNIEIVDYINAVRNLRFAEQCTSVYNPSITDVWIEVDFEKVKIPAGATITL